MIHLGSKHLGDRAIIAKGYKCYFFCHYGFNLSAAVIVTSFEINYIQLRILYCIIDCLQQMGLLLFFPSLQGSTYERIIKYVSYKYVVLIRDRKDRMIWMIDTLYVVLMATLFSAAS
jgi:hypothetical protein